MNGVDKGWAEQFLPPALRIDDTARAAEVEQLTAPLRLDGTLLQRVMHVFKQEMEAGLAQRPSSLQMENTYVPELPNGSEEGLFLALDLGGTNFRVLLLELSKGELVREEVKQYHISDELRLGHGEKLFDFLAECVADFVHAEGLQDLDLPLGFTFSFPMVQHSISSGNLTTWTKSFNCPGMEGVDVAALLQRYLCQRNLRVRVVVLLNDTTGTLVAGARFDHKTGIGVILGTGSNGCYLERAERVQHWEAAHERVHDVIVDVEWGAFGDNGCLDFIKTQYDRDVDAASLLVNSFTFEKYIGGKYLGDLVGAVLTRLAECGHFPARPTPRSLTTTHVSLMEQEYAAGATQQTCAVLAAACGCAVDAEDARVAQYACRVLSNRAAQLVSACIATLLRRMERDFVAVAVDGSVFKCHPHIRGLMERYVALLAPQHKFAFHQAEDGSGKGSALTAAIAARLQKAA